MAWYPTINDTIGTDIFGIFSNANQISNNVLMPMILLTIGIISLIGFTYTNKSFFRGLTYSGFFCSILSVPLVLMSMLNPDYMYLSFFLTAVGLVGVRLSEAPS
jgi:hypothetical protein